MLRQASPLTRGSMRAGVSEPGGSSGLGCRCPGPAHGVAWVRVADQVFTRVCKVGSGDGDWDMGAEDKHTGEEGRQVGRERVGSACIEERKTIRLLKTPRGRQK